jgi:hypothetical protein
MIDWRNREFRVIPLRVAWGERKPKRKRYQLPIYLKKIHRLNECIFKFFHVCCTRQEDFNSSFRIFYALSLM